MQTDRRIDEKRIEVHRPVQIVTGDDRTTEGYTKNLSADGVRARFESKMEPGANVLVRLALVDGADPIEKQARVVWSAPDLYGEGIEVGLRLLEFTDEQDEPAQDPGPTQAAGHPGCDRGAVKLRRGQMVEVETGGIGIEAMIEGIGDLNEDGTIQVTLSIAEDSLGTDHVDDTDDDILDEERWKPRPFRDAYRRVRLYAGPVLKVLGRILAVVLRVLGVGIGWVWDKLPARFTSRAAGVWERIALRRRFSSLVARLVGFARAASDRLHPPRQIRQAGE